MLTALMTMVTLGANPSPSDDWHGRSLLNRTALAAAYVEPVVYRPGFVVGVWVRNLSSKTIGVTHSSERWFIHPNQWQFSPRPRRDEIDERRMVPQKLDASRCARLRASFAAKQLVMLEPSSSLQVFVAFNGKEPQFADAVAGFLVVSFDGQVLVTDGATCESVDAFSNGIGVEVAFPLPVQPVELPPPSAK